MPVYHFPVGVDVIDAEVFNVAGESLVEPEIAPPFHRNQVAKPLHCLIVTDYKYQLSLSHLSVTVILNLF